jgi:hypothetical protein
MLIEATVLHELPWKQYMQCIHCRKLQPQCCNMTRFVGKQDQLQQLISMKQWELFDQFTFGKYAG